MTQSPREDWFAESPVGGYQQRYRILQRLHTEQTKFQRLEILELESVGRSLVLDGALQTSIGEEFAYHEPLVHVSMFAHPHPRRVLIIGGGDGGALRHVLLHASIEHVVQVEIDEGVVSSSLKYLPEISRGAFSDPRVTLRIEDGAHFMAETSEQFDVVLVDSTDPIGPAAVLVEDPFLQSARRVLAPDGIMVMQAGSPLLQPSEWVATVSGFRRTFRIVRPYLGWVMVYPGVVWSWVAGSMGLDPTTIDDITVAARLEKLPERLRIYNPAVHRASFALPNFVKGLAEYDRSPTSADLQAIGHPFPRVVGPR